LLIRLFEAGPLFLILTALIAIFTVGLDNSENTNGISAYSVFNRGFSNLLGSIDVESLVNQYVGGGFGGGQHPQPPERMAPEDDYNEFNPPVEFAPPQKKENVSRKSGKKARRKDLELRKEMQRQRLAAREMGFAGQNDGIVAMNDMHNEDAGHNNIEVLEHDFEN